MAKRSREKIVARLVAEWRYFQACNDAYRAVKHHAARLEQLRFARFGDKPHYVDTVVRELDTVACMIAGLGGRLDYAPDEP